jgi:hypothetical protein
VGSIHRVIVAVVLSLTVAGCSHRSAPEPEAGPPARTTVRVENQGFADMNIYVLSGGQRIRLGLATGNTTTTFTIPSYLVGGLTPLRFLADPVGGRRSPVSDEITVKPGDQVVLTIPPQA